MRLLLLLALLLAGPRLQAADPVAPTDEQVLTPFLRELLLKSMPQPLGESGHNWGQQREVNVGVKWHRLRPEVVRGDRNDGHWTKVIVEAVDPANTFGFGLHDLKSPAPNTTTFEATLTLNVRLTHEQQFWKAGHRLYAGEVRGTARVSVKVHGEMTTRFEQERGNLLPTAIVRVRVTDADLTYADVKCEHIARLDGRPAEVVGDVALRTLKRVKPALESSLKEKANAAIVAGADTKEIRVELDKLFPGRGVLLKP